MCPLLLLGLLFLLFLLFLSVSFIYFVCYSCLVVTDMPKGPKTVTDPTMPSAPISAIPTTPTPVGLGNFLTLVLFSIKTFIVAFISFLCIFLMSLCDALFSFSGPSSVEVAPTSQFKIGSRSATIPYLVSEVAAFFTRFDQVKTNDLDLSGFWGAGSPYVDFHGF